MGGLTWLYSEPFRSSAEFPFLFLSRNVTIPFFRLVTLVRKRGYTNHNQRTHCVPQRIDCWLEGPFILVRNVKSYLSEGLQIVTHIMFYTTLCYTYYEYIETDIRKVIWTSAFDRKVLSYYTLSLLFSVDFSHL